MLSDKNKLIVKIIMIILMLSTIAIVTEFSIEIFAFKLQDSSYELSFFAEHFSITLSLILVGVITFLMTLLVKRRFSDDSKDGFMVIVSLLLVLSGIVFLIYSFVVDKIF